MRNFKEKIFMAILIVFVFIPLNVFATVKYISLERFYDYDKNMPLNEEVKEVSKTRSTTTYEIFFDTVNNQRISGLLVVPNATKKPFPVVLYLHGSGMTRELPDMAKDYVAAEGYAVFSISIQNTNERRKQGKGLTSGYFLENRNGLIQTVIDYRRGIDYLQKRDDIDKERIGVIGLSLGGVVGSILFSIDDRIKVAAFAVSGGNLELMAKKSILIKSSLDFSKLNYDMEVLKEIVAPIDPINFASKSKGRPVIMVNGREDEIVPPECTKLLYENFSEPKHIIWYEGGHVPTMDSIMLLAKRALRWLRTYLVEEKITLLKNNHSPVAFEMTISPENKITQGEALRIYVKASDEDKNINFVKVYMEADDTEALLYDNGRGVDKKKGDGIFSGQKKVEYNSKIGETKIIAWAVDYNGDVSNEVYNYITILPYSPPPNTHAPQIIKVDVPSKIKIGSKASIVCEVVDEDNDIDVVQAKLLEFGLPVNLEREGTSNIYKYTLDIPEVEDIISSGTYHIAIRAKDKTRQYSERKVFNLELVGK